MEKPKKLIRTNIDYYRTRKKETEEIKDQDKLNKLYALKIQEELIEIQKSNHKDITEFADLIQVVYDFSFINGFSPIDVDNTANIKYNKKGRFSRLVSINLNPNNPSNALYFNQQIAEKVITADTHRFTFKELWNSIITYFNKN